MASDTIVKCSKCGKQRRVNFAYCLQNGWPTCCGGLTMTMTKTCADIDKAVKSLPIKVEVKQSGF